MTILKHHRENLEKLRDYLRNLPGGYNYFDMGCYFEINKRLDDSIRLKKSTWTPLYVYEFYPLERIGHCGAVACAVGHGPAAGVPFTEGVNFNRDICNFRTDWEKYAFDSFVEKRDQFNYLFSHKWTAYEPHHHQAADRIDKYLKAGGYSYRLPKPWDSTRMPTTFINGV